MRLNLGQKSKSFFVDIALRAVSTLENDNMPFCGRCFACGLDLEKTRFLYIFDFLKVLNVGYLVRFEPREYARRFSFGNCCRMH